MKSTKAQGLSINYLIIAIITLLVLVVVVFAFMGGFSRFQTGLSDCKARGGTVCINTTKGETCPEGQVPIPTICKDSLDCCISIK